MSLPLAALVLGGLLMIAGAVRGSADLTVSGLAVALWTIFACALLKAW